LGRGSKSKDHPDEESYFVQVLYNQKRANPRKFLFYVGRDREIDQILFFKFFLQNPVSSVLIGLFSIGRVSYMNHIEKPSDTDHLEVYWVPG